MTSHSKSLRALATGPVGARHADSHRCDESGHYASMRQPDPVQLSPHQGDNLALAKSAPCDKPPHAPSVLARSHATAQISLCRANATGRVTPSRAIPCPCDKSSHINLVLASRPRRPIHPSLLANNPVLCDIPSYFSSRPFDSSHLKSNWRCT